LFRTSSIWQIQAIVAEFGEPEPDPLEDHPQLKKLQSENLIQEYIIDSLTTSFVGRKSLVKRLFEFVDSDVQRLGNSALTISFSQALPNKI